MVGVEYRRRARLDWRARIGELMPGSPDHWWTLAAGDSTEALAREVVFAVRDYALPAMQSARARFDGDGVRLRAEA
jgi:hypothetical protein